MPHENQHWVPKFLIKNFVDKDGRVFCLNIQTEEVTKPPPKKATSRIGFNVFLINGEAVSFEDQLEKIETRAAPVLKRIINSRSVAGLNKNERSWVANFIAAQSFRTEAFHKGLELTCSREQFGAMFAQLWRSAFLVSDEIERRKWLVMTIQHDDIFYLGDHPVVLQHTEMPSSSNPLGFDVEGVEIFLPLTPKCALYMPCLSISEQIISGYEGAVFMHRQIRSATLRETMLLRSYPDPLDLAQRVMRMVFTKPSQRVLTYQPRRRTLKT